MAEAQGVSDDDDFLLAAGLLARNNFFLIWSPLSLLHAVALLQMLLRVLLSIYIQSLRVVVQFSSRATIWLTSMRSRRIPFHGKYQ